MDESSQRWMRIIIACCVLIVVALAIVSGTWAMLHGRPGPGLIFAVCVVSGAGAARLLLFD